MSNKVDGIAMQSDSMDILNQFNINLDFSVPQQAQEIHTVTRSYEELSKKEQKKVDEMMVSLMENLDPSGIATFAAEEVAKISDFSGSLFDNCKIGDMEAFKETMTSFRNQLNSVDAKNLTGKVKKSDSLAKIPVVGTMLQRTWEKKVEEYFQKTKSVSKFVDETITELGTIRFSILDDMNVASNLKKKTYTYAKQLELYVITINKVIDQLTDARNALKEKAEPNDLEVAYKISDLDNTIMRLQRKAYSISAFRVTAMQNIPQLTFIENADKAIADVIEEAVTNVIPLWKHQFAIAYYAYRLKGATVVIEAVNKTTDEVLRSGVVMTHEAIASTAKVIETPVISIETLQVVNNQIKQMMDSVVEIHANANEARKQAMPAMKAIQEELIVY